MNYLEILSAFRKVEAYTFTIRYTRPPLFTSTQIPTEWNICLHYSPEELMGLFEINSFHSWEAETLQDGIIVLKSVLESFKYEEGEIEKLVKENVEDLKLKERAKVFFCAYIIRGGI